MDQFLSNVSKATVKLSLSKQSSCQFTPSYKEVFSKLWEKRQYCICRATLTKYVAKYIVTLLEI